MNKSFSVIIPCFNTQEYIKKCLDSLVNQNYDINLIQIIVIDDGSKTDDIKKIVLEYKEKYSNIEYHYKENNNWGSVINYAIENKLVKNDYVSILDSDDFFHKDAYKNINSLVGDNDLFVGSFKKFFGNKNKGHYSTFYFPFKRKIKNKYEMQTPICLPMVFFYKKEIFYMTKKIKEKIPHQDGPYISEIISNSKSLIFSYKIIGYYFINRPGNTVTQKWDEKRFNIEYDICKYFLENDLQELISFRLNIKEFKNFCKEKKIKFEITRKFKFKWLPFGLNAIYFLFVYLIMHKRFFYKK